MSKGGGGKSLLILAMLGALGVGALALYVKEDPNAAHVPADLRRPEAQASASPAGTTRMKPEKEPAKPVEGVQIPEIHGDQVSLSLEKQDVPDGKDAKLFLAESVLIAAGVDNLKVLGVDVRNGVAVINFGDAGSSGMGSSQEASCLKALQIGFGQFPEVQKIQVTKEGEPMETLGGHIETTDPLPVIRGT